MQVDEAGVRSFIYEFKGGKVEVAYERDGVIKFNLEFIQEGGQ